MPLFCARQYKHAQKNSQTLCMKIIKSNERFYLFADKLEGSGTKSLNSQSRDKSRRNSFENRTSRGTKRSSKELLFFLKKFSKIDKYLKLNDKK